MIDKDQFQTEVVRKNLTVLGLWSQAAEDLLMLTACAESRLGTYVVQVRGPAKGVFQMEPATHDDIWNNFLKYKPTLVTNIRSSVPFEKNGIPNDSHLIWNMGYAAMMARVHYFRQPASLPLAGDWQALAEYWKKYYNTHLGAGTVEGCLKKCEGILF